MKVNYIGYIVIIFMVFLALKIYKDSDTWQLKCITSDVDNKEYCVRERSKLTLAADKLAITNQNMYKLVNHCRVHFPERDNVKRLVSGYNPKKIYETLPTSEFTAYSENKGEKLAFCLDTERGNQGKLIDQNTLTFVATHELAHIATKSIGHTEEFWANFKFLLEIAKKINVYNPIDYGKKPARYCGMDITDNPYFDY
jgi:plasmid maintenance system antidote protein VapI